MGIWKKMPKYSIIKIDLYHLDNDFFVEASKKMKKLNYLNLMWEIILVIIKKKIK